MIAYFKSVFRICALLLFAGSAAAGYILDLDHAVFRASDSLGYVEVYAGVQRGNLVFGGEGDTLQARFAVVLEVMRGNEQVISDTMVGTDLLMAGESAVSGQFFPVVYRFIMKPDTYLLRASLYQDFSRASDEVVDTLVVRSFANGILQMSDIELGASLKFENDSSRFVKNGIHMIPNPTLFYGTRLPLFYYYAEVYGLPFNESAADSYVVVRRIHDTATAQLARAEQRKVQRIPGTTAVVADGFPATTLKTGSYVLELEVQVPSNGARAIMQRKFWTYRPEDFAAGRRPNVSLDYQARLLKNEPSILEVLDPDSALDWMHYILEPREAKRVDRLNTDGKRQFLREYWSQRETAEPGSAARYFARIAVANQRYSYLKRPGWKTDRGRVFARYGEPDNVTRNYGVARLPDHEIWTFDQLEGGVIFVFLDRSGFGDLDLVHSTMRGEINNPDWMGQYGSRSRSSGEDITR